MRSISQIYSEAVAMRNSYLQLTELDSGRTGSKLSIMNLITYCTSVMIYVYETILDVFQVNIAQLISNRINGTAKYYVTIAKKFQFNQVTQRGDELIFDEDTFQIRYKVIDDTHKIIEQAAYQMYDNNSSMLLKVCKKNEETDVEGGSSYIQLSDNELTAFKGFIDEIKFLGAKITCLSIPGDILRVNAKIIYDDLYLTETQAFDAVKDALKSYIKNLGYNADIYYQSIVDAIQNVEHVVSVTGEVDYVKIYRTSYNVGAKAYNLESTQITNKDTAYSGYLTFVDMTDEERPTTLKKGSGYLLFVANSTI